MTIDHTPPADTDAEAILLACWCSGEPGIMQASRVDPQDFYRNIHRTIAATLTSLLDDGITPDIYTLADRLRTDLGVAKCREIVDDVAKIVGAVGEPSHAEHYANIVRNAAAARRSLQATTILQQSILDGEWDRDRIAAKAREIEKATESVTEHAAGWAKTWSDEALQDLVTVRSADSHKTLSWGISEMDRVGCVIRNGAFPVVAGSPGSGKTTFLLQWAFRTADRLRKPIVFLSLEMHPAELVKKAILGWSRLPDPHYLGVDAEARDMLEKAKAWTDQVPVMIPHRFPRKLGELCGWIHRTAALVNPAAFVIDYLGLIQAPGSSSYEKTTEASKRVRAVALSTTVPIIAAHQLNRRSGRERDLPELHDLRDSGQVEQDATEVLMLHSPWAAATAAQRNGGTVDKHQVWMVIRKNRHGESNRKVEMRFSPETSTIEPITGRTGDA